MAAAGSGDLAKAAVTLVATIKAGIVSIVLGGISYNCIVILVAEFIYPQKCTLSL